MINSFWSTVEIECTASDFPYEDYIKYCKEYSRGAPLSRVGYKLLGELFHAEMGQSMGIVGKFTLDESTEIVYNNHIKTQNASDN